MEKERKQKKIVYVDMDNVLVDFPHGIECLSLEDKIKSKATTTSARTFFSQMRHFPTALESYRILAEHFDTYILSTSPWKNPSAWVHKLEWVQKHLGDTPEDPAYKRLMKLLS